MTKDQKLRLFTLLMSVLSAADMKTQKLFTSGAVATAKSRAPKVQSEEEEVEVWVIFPPGKI